MITLDELTERLPLLTASIFGIGFILFLLALRMFRRSRGARYWIHRRQAGQRGFRMLIFSMLFLSLSLGFCIATFIFNAIEDTDTPATQESAANVDITVSDTPTPTDAPTETIAVTPTPTDAPTETVAFTSTPTETDSPSATPTSTATEEATSLATEIATDELLETAVSVALNSPTTSPTFTQTASNTPTTRPSNTRQPSATHTQTPTRTPSPTQSPTFTQTASNTPTPTPNTPTSTPSNTPLPTLPFSAINITPRATPDPAALLNIEAVADGIDNGEPLTPSSEFSVGIRRIYFFVNYQEMATGVLWRWQLLRDDERIAERALLWGPAGDGETFFFVGQQGGYIVGDYELQLFIGDSTTPVDSVLFSVIP